MGTYRARGPEVFWKKLEDCVPLYSSPIVSFRFIRLLISFLLVSYAILFFLIQVTWKLLIAFHRILQDGDATVVTKSMKHASLIGMPDFTMLFKNL